MKIRVEWRSATREYGERFVTMEDGEGEGEQMLEWSVSNLDNRLNVSEHR